VEVLPLILNIKNKWVTKINLLGTNFKSNILILVHLIFFIYIYIYLKSDVVIVFSILKD
jgi:integral membrane sensor domain MASE1